MATLSTGVFRCTQCQALALDPRRFMPLRRTSTVHPVLDGCRACGHDAYVSVGTLGPDLPEVYACGNCTTLFVDPERFMRRTVQFGAGALIPKPLSE